VTLTLYGRPGTAAMAAQAALEEAGAEYADVTVEVRDGRLVGPPEFAGLSPHGRVPVLVDGDLVLYESAAIALHVADRFPESGLMPPVGTPERSRAYSQLVYLTNTVQATFMWWFYPERVTADPAAQAEITAGTERQLNGMFDHLDGLLADRPYLLGERCTAPDLYLFMLTRWARNLPRPAWSLPYLGPYYARLSERPSIARMLERQGIEAYAAPG
jgi:glutathione S-transferase